MSQELRNSPRTKKNIEIHFKSTASFINAYILNVSNGGIFIKTDDPCLLDTVLTLKITLPGDLESFETEGKVVWINMTGGASSYPKGMGIKFINLPKKYAEIIHKFVEEHLSEKKESSLF